MSGTHCVPFPRVRVYFKLKVPKVFSVGILETKPRRAPCMMALALASDHIGAFSSAERERVVS